MAQRDDYYIQRGRALPCTTMARGLGGWALGLALAGCALDPHGLLADSDLHVVVTQIPEDATTLELRVEPVGADTAIVRVPGTDGHARLDIFVPSLPAGRYAVRARALGPAGEQVSCATFPERLDAAGAPWDITLDMGADHDPACGADTPPKPDAARPEPHHPPRDPRVHHGQRDAPPPDGESHDDPDSGADDPGDDC